jgi:Uma2 family endonuclease
MSTTIEPRPRVEAPPPGDQCVELRGLDWKGYLTLLRLRGERPRPKIVYLDGSAYLMSPSLLHESWKERLGRFINELVAGLRIPCKPTASTTFRRRAKRGGVEGDLSYYLEHEPELRGKRKVSLRTDPPPDLAIEVVYSHDADAALEVYRRFRVPEVWVCDESELRFLVLGPNGRYAESVASRAFPFLTPADVFAWVRRPETVPETDWLLDLRAWVRDVLAPRARMPGGRTP